MERIKHSYKPGIAILSQMFNVYKPIRPDDNDSERDVTDLTLTKFIQ